MIEFTVDAIDEPIFVAYAVLQGTGDLRRISVATETPRPPVIKEAP